MSIGQIEINCCRKGCKNNALVDLVTINDIEGGYKVREDLEEEGWTITSDGLTICHDCQYAWDNRNDRQIYNQIPTSFETDDWPDIPTVKPITREIRPVLKHTDTQHELNFDEAV